MKYGPNTGFQVMIIVLDDDGICYTHLLSRISGLKDRARTNVPKKAPINCHAGKGVLPYNGTVDDFVLPFNDTDYQKSMDFSIEHPVHRKPANIPKLEGKSQKLVDEHNEVKYDLWVTTTEESSVVVIDPRRKRIPEFCEFNISYYFTFSRVDNFSKFLLFFNKKMY